MKKRISVVAGVMVAAALVLSACGKSEDEKKEPDAPRGTNPLSDVNLNTDGDFGLGVEVVNLAPQTLAPGEATLTLNVKLPEGYKFNTLAPFQASFSSSNDTVVVSEDWSTYEQIDPPMPLEVPLTLSAGQGALTADLTIYWCEAVNETLCFVDEQQVVAPLVVAQDAIVHTAAAELTLTPPVIP
jgi:hypothetical protein